MPPQGGLPATGSVEPDALSRRDNDPALRSGGQLPVHCGRENGYSANLRHMGRVQRTCIGSLHEAFSPSVEEDFLTGELDSQPDLNCSI
eukprot:226970-Heterocapsa_arctica.AAC.1